jgi:hypothetical protein
MMPKLRANNRNSMKKKTKGEVCNNKERTLRNEIRQLISGSTSTKKEKC